MEEQRAPHPSTVAFGELPELTRALRALGSSRRGAGSQLLFFGPLLDARRRAADARSPHARVRAFSAADLNRALERAIERIVSAWPDVRPPARRALRHELIERVQPYAEALRLLGDRAMEVLEAGEDRQLATWRDWTKQLVDVFRCADRTWLALQPVIEAMPRRHE